MFAGVVAVRGMMSDAERYDKPPETLFLIFFDRPEDCAFRPGPLLERNLVIERVLDVVWPLHWLALVWRPGFVLVTL